jgi:flagellar protein FliS
MNKTNANPWQAYRQVATQTATPGQLVLMLYDGALRFLEQSLTGFAKDDPAEFHQTIGNNLLRAQQILHELNISLNLEAGGDVAANLRRLYEYLDRRLLESNIKKEEAGIKEVIARITVLRDAWAQMLSGQLSDAGQVTSDENKPRHTSHATRHASLAQLAAA